MTTVSEAELARVEGGWIGQAATLAGIGLIGFAIGGIGGIIFVAVAKSYLHA